MKHFLFLFIFGISFSQNQSDAYYIDVQGFRKVRDLRRIDSSVFIALPVEELENRLRLRGTDSDEVIARRLRAAALELSCAHEYEHTLINDNLVEAIDRLATIWGRFFTQAC